MKYLLLSLTLVTVSAFAQTERQKKQLLLERMESELGVFNVKEVGICRYELAGPKLPLEKVFEEEDMDYKTCEARARKALDQNTQGYTKALLKHPSNEKWVVIERNKK